MSDYLSCKQIYDAMKRIGVRRTDEREYAYEFELANGQVIYVKRLLDKQSRKNEPSRLMIHPALKALKSELQCIEDAEFKFGPEGNMSTAFAKYPKSSISECIDNPTEYGAGVNFKSEKGLTELINFLESL
ncbi:hypothetical protein [Acinetobacter sp. YH12236]|uniref:hypothetical protein n=1 Tax=Acinetobacter sp. YH12236 TaxID=2601163 RepID=UPI0015D21D34|nr:hypothetical protein [Acinetobacter sp. YH12236]